MRDRNFILSAIHASVIFRFPELDEFSESSALFKKNAIENDSLGQIYIDANVFWRKNIKIFIPNANVR